MKDSWCEPLIHNGKKIQGAAAREARISSAGGMDNIIGNFVHALTFAQNFTSVLYEAIKRGYVVK